MNLHGGRLWGLQWISIEKLLAVRSDQPETLINRDIARYVIKNYYCVPS